MDNTTDLFMPEYASLALPASAVAVFIDGVLCDSLEPVEIVRGGWPEFGHAKLIYNPAARSARDGQRDMSPLGEIEDGFGMGRQVSLRQFFNATPPQAAVASLVLFEGQVEGVEATIGPIEDLELADSSSQFSLVVRDFSAVLERITVYGQYVGAGNGVVLLSGLETTFNPGGKGNRGLEATTINGQSCIAFCADTAEARVWRLADVIDYLLCVHLPAGQLYRPDIEQLLALTQTRLARDLDITGLNLLEALYRCCEPADLQFRFVPRLAETGPRQAIVFYRNGRGRVVELNCQEVGQPLSLSRTSISALHSRRDFYPLTHRYVGRGDFKVYEATFELVKAWDPALESTDYYTFCASTNPEFQKVRDVYRKWCLNEAGDYVGEPYNQGQPHDFARIFEGGNYVVRRRRFWPTLSTDSHGRSLGYFLEISFDGGSRWRQYSHAFNNLLEECGIWLSDDQLDVDTWVAALNGVLRFRVTASVVSDERLTCIVADGPVGSAAPVIDHIFTLPRRFQCRRVSRYSVFAGNVEGFGEPNEVDDTTALYEFMRQRASATAAIIERTDVQTPTLALHFEPGDRVTSSPDGCDLLNCRRDNRSLVWIERAQMDFKNQCTHLKLVRQRAWSESMRQEQAGRT